MDLLTLAGVLLGGAAIVFGFALEGGHFSMLFQFEALVIVLGGTLGAVMIQNTWARFFDAVKQLRLAFVRAREVDRKNLSDLLEWGDRAKLDGLLAFESMDVSGIHPFARRGLNCWRTACRLRYSKTHCSANSMPTNAAASPPRACGSRPAGMRRRSAFSGRCSPCR